ncbi:MAG: hypothetical protein JJU36_07820 [Phycisphaeraceae bacterium]|nr:hypothetical protein [Phycisphaeraceae bacterium]
MIEATTPVSETPTGNTGGYFTVDLLPSGKWTLLNPEGRPTLFRGVCGVNRAGTQGGRLAKPGPYAETVDRKYEYQRSPKAFVDATLGRLRDWGFNALGSWVTEEFFDQGMPYTEIVEFAKLIPPLKAPGIRVPDVYDPRWREAIDIQAGKLCTPLRKSRELIGYFTDNELGWGQPATDEMWGASDMVNRKGPTLLQAILGMPEDAPAKREAWAFVMGRHADLAALGRAWEIEIKRPEDLIDINASGVILFNSAYGRDQDAFAHQYALAYVQQCSQAIRRHDPNHLILGARFGAPPGDAILRAFVAPWVDVVSANNYRVNLYGRMDEYWNGHERPILIGEYAWASPPFVDPAHWSEQERASGESAPDRVRRVGRKSLEDGLAHPGVVGYTWYRWVQNAKGFVGYGLVDCNDEPSPFNVPLITEINHAMAARWGA